MIADFVASHSDSRPDSPQESREYWIGSPVQERIRQILSTDMSSTTIKRCRIAWAMDVNPDLGGEGIRSIVSSSGLGDQFVQKTLPAEGETCALGLIRCVKQGEGGLDPLTVRRSRYVVIGNRSDPTTNHYITSERSGISPAQPGDGWINDSHAHDVVNRCGVSKPGDTLFDPKARRALLPGHDVWSPRNMGDLGWALAVVYGPRDIGHLHEDGPTLSLAELRRLTDKTQQGVYAALARWEKAENRVPFMKRETPGKPTMLFIMFSQLVDDDYHLRTDKQNRLEERAMAESKLHKRRMTAAGARAWVLASGKEWLFKDETPPVIPSDVLAEGEQAVYDHLVALAEAEEAVETTVETVVTQEPELTPEVSQVLLKLMRGWEGTQTLAA
jgi:hypothetical protein